MSQDFVASEIDASRLRAELEAQAPRRWQFGDVYAPHDLTGVEAKKWKKSRRTPELDAFDTLGLDPLKEYKVESSMHGLAWSGLMANHHAQIELLHHLRVHD